MSNPTIKPAPAAQPKPPIPCAWGACDKLVERGVEYHFIVNLMTRGPDPRLGGYQCPDVSEILAGNLDEQHFCCSLECAALCAHACIDEHLVPRHQAEVAHLAEKDAAQAQEDAAIAAYRAAQAAINTPEDNTHVAGEN